MDAERANDNIHYSLQTAAMPEMHTLECKNLECNYLEDQHNTVLSGLMHRATITPAINEFGIVLDSTAEIQLADPMICD